MACLGEETMDWSRSEFHSQPADSLLDILPTVIQEKTRNSRWQMPLLFRV